MRARYLWGVCSLGIGLLSAVTIVQAAEDQRTTNEPISEGVQPGTPDATLEQLRAAIETESDPELKSVMKEQLQLVESGQLDLHTLEATGTERGSAQAAGAQGPTEQHVGPRLAEGLLPTSGLLGQPADGAAGGLPAERLPAEVRTQLEKLFQEQGTGDPSQDANVRAEAERILKEHGIDPREMGTGHEGEWDRGREQGQQGGSWRDANHDNLDDDSGSVLDGIGRSGDNSFRDDRSLRETDTEAVRPSAEGIEHMAPEAREQLERFYGEHEASASPSMDREVVERTFEVPTQERATESPERTYEASVHESTYEAPQHEYQAPEHTSEGQTPPQP